jgi:DNA-binding transcriptional LysR family regulator
VATNQKFRAFIRSRLKIRQLALLAHLDEQRCVLRAAEALGITQPAASKLLREFEDALQVQLFERHARGIVPTWYGEILVRHARSILSEISLAQEEIAALKSGLSGQASVGTVTNPGTNLVPAAVALLKRKHPGLLVSIELDHSRPLVEKLLQGQLDMLVARIMDSRGAQELRFEPLCDERHAVIAGAHHPLAGKTHVRLEDLVDQPWILPPQGSVLRDRLMGVFLQHGLKVPVNVVQTQSLPVITSLLRETSSLVALPQDAVQPLIESGHLAVIVKDLGLEIGAFGIVTRRDYMLSPGALALLGCLRETAARLYPSLNAQLRQAHGS